jgi:hypothetical protein
LRQLPTSVDGLTMPTPGDPTANWVRPNVVVDNTRALTREQVAAPMGISG